MPAKSKKQQAFMGAELARKRAGQPTQTDMGAPQLEEFAATKTKGLPEKVGKPKPKGRQSKPRQKAKFIDTTLNKRKF